MWTISFTKRDLMKTEYLQRREIMENTVIRKPVNPKTYDAKDLFRKMDKARRDCLIPSELVPKCPVCGGNMAMNLRCDNYFVEDEAWHEAATGMQTSWNRIRIKRLFFWNLELDLTPR